MIASWCESAAKVKLDVDWPALGFHPANVHITQPAIETMQSARAGTIGIQDELTVAAGGGVILVIRGS
eukprot:COSAG02_NODE_20068_length_850_cov_0.756325_1_plen_68_part_00